MIAVERHLGRLVGLAIVCGLLALPEARALRDEGAAANLVPVNRLRIVAPAAPGGGWDQTARAMQSALVAAGLARHVEVENVAGAAGTIGLARFVTASRGDASSLMITGLVMIGGIVSNQAPVSLETVTPIARLTGEPEVIVVPAASRFRTLADLANELRRDPAAVSWAGGSAGGTDHILVGLIARAIGVDPQKTNYIAFAGGGEAVTALLGNHVSAGVSGYGELVAQVNSGALRALAVSSPPERSSGVASPKVAALDSGQRTRTGGSGIPSVSVPTLQEQGVDVELVNWRGIVAPPGISIAEREGLIHLIDAMVVSRAWRETLERTGWSDLYLPGERFGVFLRAEEARIGAIVRTLQAGGSDAPQSNYPLVVGAGLLLVMAGLIREKARRLPAQSDGRLNKSLWPRPFGLPEKSKPKGLHHIRAGERRQRVARVGAVVAGMVAYLVFLERAGFIVTSAALFWLTARAFGSRRWVRDAVAAIIVSAAAYVLFTRGLSLALPAGFWTR